jgi:signal peptidase II
MLLYASDFCFSYSQSTGRKQKRRLKPRLSKAYSQRRISLKILYVSALIVFADQLSKIFIKGFSVPFLNIQYEGMYPGERIRVIGDFFRLTFIENPGMAFGFDPGIDFKLWISVFSLIAGIGLVIYLYKIRHNSFSLRFSIALILGGAVGNLIDRTFYGVIYSYAPLFHGKVVDFLDFDFFDLTFLGKNFERWAIFNIADASVTLGVLFLIFFYKKHQNEEQGNKKLPDQEQSAGDMPADKNDRISSINPETETGNKETGNERINKGEEI